MGPFLRALLTAAVPPQLVKNNSDERIAVKIRVDNKPTLPTGACFVVRPKRQREMQGFQVKRTFHGGQFADEWAAFVFGRPSLIEKGSDTAKDRQDKPDNQEIGCVVMDVYEAVEMECPQTDLASYATSTSQEAVSAEKKDSVFSSLTVPGARYQQAARPVQRWYRDGLLLQSVKLYYKEEHALIFHGVSPTEFGHPAAAPAASVRQSQAPKRKAAPLADYVEHCDLTQDDEEDAGGDTARGPKWSRVTKQKVPTEDVTA